MGWHGPCVRSIALAALALALGCGYGAGGKSARAPASTPPIPVRPAPRGTCATGGKCVAVPAGELGWHTLAQPIAAEVSACPPGLGHACCNSAECTGGSGGGCFLGPLWYCGGAAPRQATECMYDECELDADCREGDHGLCLPRGAFGEVRSRCVNGGCRLDRDCGERSGGACMPFFDPCSRRLTSFHCTYDDSACRTDQDCGGPGIAYCKPLAAGKTECARFYPRP